MGCDDVWGVGRFFLVVLVFSACGAAFLLLLKEIKLHHCWSQSSSGGGLSSGRDSRGAPTRQCVCPCIENSL